MGPSTLKSTSCRPGLFWYNERSSLQNIKKINGNTDFVKVVIPEVSLFSGIWYQLEAC